MMPTEDPRKRRPPVQLRGFVIKPGRMSDGQQHPAIVLPVPTKDHGNHEFECSVCDFRTLTANTTAICPNGHGPLSDATPASTSMSSPDMQDFQPTVAP